MTKQSSHMDSPSHGVATDEATASAAGGPQRRTIGQLRRLQAVVASWVREDRGSTHWDGCETAHVDCALSSAADALREVAERVRRGEAFEAQANLLRDVQAFVNTLASDAPTAETALWERIEAVLETAYREGHVDGYNAGLSDGHPLNRAGERGDVDAGWLSSVALAKLRRREKGSGQ